MNSELLTVNVIFVILGFIALFGNVLLVILIWKSKELRKLNCIWLLGVLGITDAMTGKLSPQSKRKDHP